MKVCWEATFLRMSKLMLVFLIFEDALESDFSEDVQANVGVFDI